MVSTDAGKTGKTGKTGKWTVFQVPAGKTGKHMQITQVKTGKTGKKIFTLKNDFSNIPNFKIYIPSKFSTIFPFHSLT